MRQLCTLFATQLASGGQVTPASALTASTVRFAGRISAKVTMPALATPPLLTAVMVQTMLSPTLALTVLVLLLTRITGPGMVTVAVFGKSFATSVELVAMMLTMVDTLLAGWIYDKPKLCTSFGARLDGRPCTVSMPLTAS